MRLFESYTGHAEHGGWIRRLLPAITAFYGVLASGNVLADAVPTPGPRAQGIVVIGASYAADWPVKTLAGQTVINKGIGGNQTSDMAQRFNHDVISENPSAVLIWGFINDIFRADSANFEKAKEQIREDYRLMILSARASNIGVIVATEVTIRRKAGVANWLADLAGRALGRTSYQDMINEQVRDVNGWLTKYATEEGIPVLDFESAIADEDGYRRNGYATEDGSHLNGAAYTALTQYTTNALRATGMAQD